MHKAGIGSHTKPNQGETNTWLTPKEIIDALGPFDLDPCAAPSPRPWRTAARHIELPEDGLAASWSGPWCCACGPSDESCIARTHCIDQGPVSYRVWLNPPYGRETDAWLEKMSTHRSGIALIFARTETSTWQQWVWPYAHSIFFFDGRLWFHRADGTRGDSNAGGPSALVSYSQADTDSIVSSGLHGVLVKVESRTGRFA